VRPLCIDLYCGLGGWSEAFLAEGYRCVGYDIEAHDYGTGGYPGELILRDVRSIHGSEFKDAAVIVASPPCQAYSYRAMPWSRAKALPPPDNTLFNECFRIQREASEAAGHHIPLIVENVRGAQKWVGRARWHYGSFYLWGDVPALMPMTFGREVMKQGVTHRSDGATNFHGVKQSGISGVRENGKGDKWFEQGAARHGSRSNSRKAASAMIAKIPFPLAQHIARVYKPRPAEVARGAPEEF
jgi:hypothetical protein